MNDYTGLEKLQLIVEDEKEMKGYSEPTLNVPMIHKNLIAMKRRLKVLEGILDGEAL